MRYTTVEGKELNVYPIQDEVVIDWPSAVMLLRYCGLSVEKNQTPIDLFVQNLLPLPSLRMKCVGPEAEMLGAYTDFLKTENTEIGSSKQEMLVTLNRNGEKITEGIAYKNADDSNLINLLSVEGGANLYLTCWAIEKDDIVTISLYSIYYAIQHALLHPVIRSRAFVGGYTEQGKRVKKIKSNNKVAYVKYDFTGPKVKKTFRAIERKCQIWWVIGHWRTLKTGKRVFINGYWKGPQRDNLAAIEVRQRNLVLEDKTEFRRSNGQNINNNNSIE